MNKNPYPPSTPNGTAAKHDGLFSQMKESAEHVAGSARDQIAGRIDSQKEKVGGTLDDVASALRKTGGDLKDKGPLPELADHAADAIERVASFVQSRTIGDIVGDVEGFARREPAIFLGAAFALGLLGGRLLKSTARRDEAEGDDLDDEPTANEGERYRSRSGGYAGGSESFGADTGSSGTAETDETTTPGSTIGGFGLGGGKTGGGGSEIP